MLIQIFFAKKYMNLKVHIRDMYLICSFVLIITFVQLIIINNFGETFNIVIFVFKIFIFFLHLSYLDKHISFFKLINF